jgi:hypothetical protein
MSRGATIMKIASVVTAATVLALSPAAAPAAVVHSVVLPDARGDTWTYSDVSGYEPAAQPAADVLRARVTHGQRAVQIRMVFDDLRRVGIQWYWFEIHTAGVTSWFIVEARKHHYRGTAYQSIEGEWVRATGVTSHIDYASDKVILRVTRRLLGDPPWVRVRLRFELRLPDGTFFTDNPTTTGPEPVFTRRLSAAAGSSGR